MLCVGLELCRIVISVLLSEGLAMAFNPRTFPYASTFFVQQQHRGWRSFLTCLFLREVLLESSHDCNNTGASESHSSFLLALLLLVHVIRKWQPDLASMFLTILMLDNQIVLLLKRKLQIISELHYLMLTFHGKELFFFQALCHLSSQGLDWGALN